MKVDYPKVYIIVLNYNNWADTIECLESLFRIDYQNYQVIVVDNNSKNNSIEYIKAWAEGKLNLWINPTNPLRRLSFPPVEKPLPYVFYNREKAINGGSPDIENKFISPLVLIQTGYNGGFAFGNNVAIKYAMAKGDFEYIWILNNDTVVDNNTLKSMLETFEISMDRSIGIVGSALIIYNEPNLLQVLGGTRKLSWINAGDGKYICPKKIYTKEFQKNFEVPGYIVGASMLIKKEVFQKIGLFDENYFMWAEEADFCFRASKEGYKLYCCGTSKVYHKEGASSGPSQTKKIFFKKSSRVPLKRYIIQGYLDRRNHIYFVKKHYGFLHAILYIFVFTPKLLRRIIGVLLLDNYKAKRISLLFKGIMDGLSSKMGKPFEIEL